MTSDPDELASHYRELADTALLVLATERNTLTPSAQAILLQELHARALAAPELPPPAEPLIEASPKWVTIDRFRDLSSAIVARGALEAAGIDCFLRDENTVRLDWQISNFIGGLRLQVREADEPTAQAVLLPETEAADIGPDRMSEPEEHCPFCGSADVHRTDPSRGLQAAALWLFALPLPGGTRSWHCAHCGKDFPERDLVLTP